MKTLDLCRDVTGKKVTYPHVFFWNQSCQFKRQLLLFEYYLSTIQHYLPQIIQFSSLLIKVSSSIGAGKKNIFYFIVLFFSFNNLGYVWFSENLRENARERKYKEKIEGKKKWRKIKNGLKVDKLFLFFTSNSFYLF